MVGVHMIGARVGELIGEAQLAVNWEAYPEDIAPLIHAHPTQNEALGEAFLALAGKPCTRSRTGRTARTTVEVRAHEGASLMSESVSLRHSVRVSPRER